MNNKKPVAIATFVSNNYGTCLQAFAIKNAVRKLGYSPLILNFRGDNKEQISKENKIQTIIKLIFRYNPWGFIKFIKSRKLWCLNEIKFKKFIDKEITPISITIDQAKKQTHFMCAISGSDMVWSPEFMQYSDAYFLKWIEKNKRISYAPSFGSTDMDKKTEAVYTSNIVGMTSLSCREKSGCDFIKKITGLDATLVCDPTLLFDKTEWSNLLNFNTVKDSTILVNCFGGLNRKDTLQLNKIAKKQKWDVRYLNAGINEVHNEQKYGFDGYGPIQFLTLSSSSMFQIVNGYHGLLFALIFNKPFVVLHRYSNEHWATHEQRMKDILDYLELSNRYISSLNEIENEHLSLDYSEINIKIAKLQDISWNYLRDALNRFKK